MDVVLNRLNFLVSKILTQIQHQETTETDHFAYYCSIKGLKITINLTIKQDRASKLLLKL